MRAIDNLKYQQFPGFQFLQARQTAGERSIIMRIGWPEIVVIVLVILLLFGAKRLPELMRSLGKSLSEFKKGKEEGEKEESEQKNKNDTEEK